MTSSGHATPWRPGRALAVLALLASGLGGCMANTTAGNPGGGEPEAGADSGAASDPDAAPAFDPSQFDVGTVHWQDLYAAYFGPDGVASCTAQSMCHGNPSQAGAEASGFVCGSSASTCWNGVWTLVTLGSTSPGFTGTFLYSAIRKDDGTGNMPYKSMYMFQPMDLARINAWVQAGSPDD